MLDVTVADQEQRCAGLRERKKLRTRHALRVAALERARAQGPEGFTVEEICADVDVAPRTFFNHFPTKDAALFDWDRSSLDELAEEVRTRPEESPLAAVSAVVRDLARALTISPIWHGQLELLREHPELAGRLARVGHSVEDAMVRGLAARTGGESGREDRIAASAALAVLHVAVSEWMAGTGDAEVREVYDDVLGRTRAAFAGLTRTTGGP